MGPTFDNFTWDLKLWLPRIITCVRQNHARILSGHATRLELVRSFIEMWDEPIACPLPYISCHVVQSVTIWVKGSYGRRAFIFVYEQILVWEFSLPSISLGCCGLHVFIAPSEFRSI